LDNETICAADESRLLPRPGGMSMLIEMFLAAALTNNKSINNNI
jgi:hypothetical protein